ncbi:hypothetical protein ACRALDRAFT_208094 [Sodiomyces alcalophilus JCM 7366]|uniref:uncharacterized protein n=1 Tax=Sodiomyces alcalophilus JCM 7366 TaxID=591952 RepID=UPI0039B4E4FC
MSYTTTCLQHHDGTSPTSVLLVSRFNGKGKIILFHLWESHTTKSQDWHNTYPCSTAPFIARVLALLKLSTAGLLYFHSSHSEAFSRASLCLHLGRHSHLRASASISVSSLFPSSLCRLTSATIISNTMGSYAETCPLFSALPSFTVNAVGG